MRDTTGALFGTMVGAALVVAISLFMLSLYPDATEADWRVDAVADYVAITASGATSDQVSGRIQRAGQ